MQFVHRISISSSPEIQAELARMGVVVDASGFVSFDVDESRTCWPEMRQWIFSRNPVDFLSTTFSKQEISDAEWLELTPNWHHGYPQPDDDNSGYLAETYDLSEFCPDCGSGLKQRAPFLLKIEPKWGRNEILQINWIFDEYFVTPELWAKVFRPYGVKYRDVLNVKGYLINNVVQLIIEDNVEFVSSGLDYETCTRCKRDIFTPVMRGKFPALSKEPFGHIVKTAQYFGSGRAASKRIVISRKLGAALDGVRGASVRPVRISDGWKLP